MAKTIDKKKYLVGIYDHEETVVEAVKKVQHDGVKIEEVYSPHPIHHIDVYLGHPRTRIPIAAFMFGATGTTLAITMITFMMKIDWPMIIGGKNNFYPPTMVPVTFEATVLIAALGMVATFLISNFMGPGKKEFMFDRRSTDDKYVMVIDLEKNTKPQSEIEQILAKHGASEASKIVEK
ncbi:MAG: DUF3341 domain-containing protein [Thermonemataceae bacterium]|nr:DUF3341 domain-containing protein [Thermonemataceae bacterium]